MSPTAQQIIESPAWAAMAESLNAALLKQFMLAPASDPQALQLVRLRCDALLSILAEMAALARAETR